MSVHQDRRRFLQGLTAMAGASVLDRVPTWVDAVPTGQLLARPYDGRGHLLGSALAVDYHASSITWGPFTGVDISGIRLHDAHRGRFFDVDFDCGPVAVVDGTLTVLFDDTVGAEMAGANT